MPAAISVQLIEEIYAPLHAIGAMGDDASGGFDRPAWSAAETAAMRSVEHIALQHNLTSRWDEVGNLAIETPGGFASWVECGSHIDTVRGGGNYDGTAGIVAGLAALIAALDEGIRLAKGLRLRIWRGEESAAFGTVSLGSRAAFGLLGPEVLSRDHDGRTLEQAIISQGFNSAVIRNGEPTIKAEEREGMAAHIELHIEQGKVLESRGIDIGIVTGIRGSIRSRVIVRGAFDHSGATPMGVEYRRDANLAMAHMQVRLDALALEWIGRGTDLVQTFGLINGAQMERLYPELAKNTVTKVSGFACFSHEVRGVDGSEVRAYVEKARELIDQVVNEFGVSAEIEEFSAVDGITTLGSGVKEALAEACDRAGASHCELASGAWHDAAVLHGVRKSDGSAIPVGMLFIPCRDGISHSPLEYSSPEQIALGATVLLEAMVNC